MYQNSYFDTVGGQRVLNSIATSLRRIADAKEKEAGKLSDEEIEKIYRKREHMYRIEDAKYQYYIQYKLGQDDVDEEEACSQLENSLSKNIWDRFVSEFSNMQDCNVAENDTWQMAIENVLSQISASEK